MNPIYMYGSGGNDPNTQTENIGDDPIKASGYGLKNLKIVAKNLDKWTTKKGQSFENLNELYNEMIGVYRRYIYHVIKLIGGINETIMVKGQDNIPYKNVNITSQKKALDFLDDNLWQTQSWLIDPKLISKIKPEGGLKTIQNLQFAALNQILSAQRLNRMLSTKKTLIGNGLSPEILIDHLFHSYFKNIDALDESEMVLQIRFSELIKKLVNEKKLNPILKTTIASVQNKIYNISKKSSKKGSMVDKKHYKYIVNMTKTN